MMKSYCNPVNMIYRFMRAERRATQPCREGSDPALVWWRKRYILATSKTSGLHWSENLCDWHFLPSAVLPAEGYGPDLWIRNGELYYVNGAPGGEIFRAVDIDSDRWEKVGQIGYLPDPKIFIDRDDRTWLCWGSAVNAPLQVVELDSKTFTPEGEPVQLNAPDPKNHGWERSGENNLPVDNVLETLGISHPDVPDYYPETYNEGAWMTCHDGIYYLQNSIPATEFNIYCDAISTGPSPSGPFEFQPDNPLSLKPGGYINGAGHSCTFTDRYGNAFHVSTMRITRHHIYERRIGIFPAGFYPDGVMYCQTRFGDWPHLIPEAHLETPADLFTGWMLLSYRAEARASSFEPGFEPKLAVDENIRTYWAASADDPCPELSLNLEDAAEIRAIQVNFAEHRCQYSADELPQGCARFTVDASADGRSWHTIWDQRENREDKTHCYHQLADSVRAQRLRVRIFAMSNGGRAALSGVRVFGCASTPIPSVPAEIKVLRRKDDPTIAEISWRMPANAIGVNVLWGLSPDRLHHCWQTLDARSLTLTSLNANLRYFVTLEAFGPGGVAERSPAVKI